MAGRMPALRNAQAPPLAAGITAPLTPTLSPRGRGGRRTFSRAACGAIPLPCRERAGRGWNRQRKENGRWTSRNEIDGAESRCGVCCWPPFCWRVRVTQRWPPRGRRGRRPALSTCGFGCDRSLASGGPARSPALRWTYITSAATTCASHSAERSSRSRSTGRSTFPTVQVRRPARPAT